MKFKPGDIIVHKVSKEKCIVASYHHYVGGTTPKTDYWLSRDFSSSQKSTQEFVETVYKLGPKGSA